MRTSSRRIAVAAALAVTLSGTVAAAPPVSSVHPGPPAQASSPVTGLAALFAPGFLLQDRNGDGHIDYLNACLALPASPSDSEVAAAANIAARLGFETASLDLPLPRAASLTGCDRPVLAIGAVAAGAGTVPAAATGLEPGAGVVTFVDGTPAAVLITGGDDAGTRAAGLAVAAHLPHLWDPHGNTLGDVADAVGRVLTAAGIEPDGVTVGRLEVSAGQPGLQRADLGVRLPAGDRAAAVAALRAVASTPPATAEPAPPAAPAGPPERAEPGEPAAPPSAPPTLRFAGLRLLRLAVGETADPDDVVWIENPAPVAAAGGRRPGGGNKDGLDLSNLYGNDGFFADTDGNLIPDRVDVLLTATGDRLAVTADLAARLGLEATGVTIPIAKTAAEIDDPEGGPPLVIIGADHPLVARLVQEDKLSLPELEPGTGRLQVVREAFGERTALVVVGADDDGLGNAVRYLAATLPHLLYRGKDRPTLKDAEDALWRAISARSPIGQAATGLYKLDTLAPRLDGRDLERVDIALHVEKADAALEGFLRNRAATLFSADEINVTIDDIDVQHANVLIDEQFEVPSEVDAFWERFHAAVLPAVLAGEPVRLRALLSEPPEIRDQVAARARSELVAAGAAAAGTEVTVLSAYKQGYSWLYDDIRPRLEGREVQNIRIRFAELGPPEDWPQQAMYTPTRWLLEIFPIDEVLARELGLDLEQIAFEKMPPDAPAYEVIATAPDGSEILRETFEPRWVLRDYFDRFPDYEKARVTTGWIEASVAGQTVIDERIVTDLERFWDHFQGDTLMRVYDHVMRTAEGKPRASDAPQFGELRIDVTLSEPDYQIGVDKEQIASMEALHEEIYFSTLHFFDVMGRLATGQPLSYPGRVIPIVRPKADGAPGGAHITFSGFSAPHPRLDLTYTERGQRPQTLRRDLPKVAVDRPTPLAATIAADGAVAELGFYVKVDFEQDRRDEFARRTSVDSIDARITNAAQTSGILAHAASLHGAGLYPRDLAFQGLGDITLTVGWQRERSAETEFAALLPRGGEPPPLPDIAALLPTGDAWRGRPLVQWDTPMPPPEAYQVLAKMDTFPQATAYQVGESYLGKPIWAIDLMAPLHGSHWSQAKATTLKPTVIYSARQHANEVSSTSHVLKLGEILLTGDEYPDALSKVNVVIHPITNPDGAQLAYDLHQITPDHMLHAGYLGALGVDVASGQGSDDPMYPETNIRPKLWETWLPDLFLNPHGYPSHEWVQVFSEYAAWVRTRATESRDWWGMRGWFMPSFSYLDDPRYPDHKDAAFDIRERITAKINAAENIRALNDRAYDRYRRYAFAWDPDAFKLDFTDDVLIYTPIIGGTGRNGTMSNPRVTVWSGTTEAPDETAYGDWMELVATGGLQWDTALLEYLLEGNHVINRDETAFSGGVAFKIDRPRPPKPAEEEQPEQQR